MSGLFCQMLELGSIGTEMGDNNPKARAGIGVRELDVAISFPVWKHSAIESGVKFPDVFCPS